MWKVVKYFSLKDCLRLEKVVPLYCHIMVLRLSKVTQIYCKRSGMVDFYELISLQISDQTGWRVFIFKSVIQCVSLWNRTDMTGRFKVGVLANPADQDDG